MVKNIVDEETQTEHKSYAEFLRWQYIVGLDVGDKVEIKIEPAAGGDEIKKEFVATYINCHINCQWQDKGVKKTT